MDFAKRETSASSSTPRTLIFEKNTVVGFGDALLQILDLLFREPSSLKIVITVIFMGGIVSRLPVEPEGQGNEDLQLELSILDAKEKERASTKGEEAMFSVGAVVATICKKMVFF